VAAAEVRWEWRGSGMRLALHRLDRPLREIEHIPSRSPIAPARGAAGAKVTLGARRGDGPFALRELCGRMTLQLSQGAIFWQLHGFEH
jgi:hypothetical protein